MLLFKQAVNTTLFQGGILTDELTLLRDRIGSSIDMSALDVRSLPETNAGGIGDLAYVSLQKVRGQAQEARALLAGFAPNASPALGGHRLVLEGYAEIYLADLFCSGIPLSTVDYDADYTLTSGLSTREVYEHALGLFNAAAPLLVDSFDLAQLAAVGRGRALLALDRYEEAGAAVAAVPDGYQYALVFQRDSAGTKLDLWGEVDALTVPVVGGPDGGTTQDIVATMPDNTDTPIGLPYRTSDDPRTIATFIATNAYGYSQYIPNKYLPLAGPVSLPIASGVEARLIEAEAALRSGGAEWWLRLNALRTDGVFDVNPDDMADTAWHAGAGGVEGLAPLPDPGSAEAQVDLLFRERAFWLYLTGQRQGDLRRLIRQYGRPQDAVYPTDPLGFGNLRYGRDVMLPVPAAERAFNPLYHGCTDRRA